MKVQLELGEGRWEIPTLWKGRKQVSWQGTIDKRNATSLYKYSYKIRLAFTITPVQARPSWSRSFIILLDANCETECYKLPFRCESNPRPSRKETLPVLSSFERLEPTAKFAWSLVLPWIWLFRLDNWGSYFKNTLNSVNNCLVPIVIGINLQVRRKPWNDWPVYYQRLLAMSGLTNHIIFLIDKTFRVEDIQ